MAWISSATLLTPIGVRALTATSAPASAKARAMPLPIPRPPPTINTFCPVMSNAGMLIMFSLMFYGVRGTPPWVRFSCGSAALGLVFSMPDTIQRHRALGPEYPPIAAISKMALVSAGQQMEPVPLWRGDLFAFHLSKTAISERDSNRRELASHQGRSCLRRPAAHPQTCRC